jgi:glycosyltransferase involved in cell wall biosynthesis
MKKVLMIVQNDFVNDIRIIKEATTLGKNDYKVKILAQYNTGLQQVEKFEFFEVERVKIRSRNVLSKNNIFIQFFKYFEFYYQCKKAGLKYMPDIIHCHDLVTLPIGWAIKKKAKGEIKYVYDSHELWFDVGYFGKKDGFAQSILNKIEQKYIKKCDEVITVSESIATNIFNRFKLKKAPVILRNIPQYSGTITKKNHFRKKYKLKENTKLLLFLGTIGIGCGIEKIIDSLQYLENNIVLVVLGANIIPLEVKKKVIDCGLQDRVFFHETVDYREVSEYTNSADVGVRLIQNICLSYYYSLPNKIFDYIQAEIPIISSNFPDVSRIINDYKVGLTVDPENTKEICEAINLLISDETMYKSFVKNTQAAKKELNWENEKKELLKLYSSF